MADDPKSVGLHMSSSLLVPSNRYRLHRDSDELSKSNIKAFKAFVYYYYYYYCLLIYLLCLLII